MDTVPTAGSLRWSRAWTVEPRREPLTLSAGADRRVVIDGVDPGTRSAVERWAGLESAVVPVGPEQRLVVDRLVALGALVPAASEPARAGVGLVGEAEVIAELARLLRPGPLAETADDAVDETVGEIVGESVGGVGPSTGEDLVDAVAPGAAAEPSGDGTPIVAVRTGTAWPSVATERLHLGLDLSLHHTIVLGPLVVPGASACLGCFDSRLARRWAPPVVPSRPTVLDALPVAAALLRVQLDLVAAGSSPLVNATVAWDLERGTTDRQMLYKFPGCSTCDPASAVGRVPLPWAAEAIPEVTP